MTKDEIIENYFLAIEENSIDESYVRSLEERIRRLEKIVYAEDITNFTSLIKIKQEELVNTLTRLSRSEKNVHFEQSTEESYLKKAQVFTNFVLGLADRGYSDKRIYIDTTNFLLTPYVTGIQRVAQQITISGIKYGATPVFHHNNELYYFDFDKKSINHVILKKNNWVLLPNASWNENNISALMQNISMHEAKIATLIHDLLPLTYPCAFTCDNVVKFRNWFFGSAVKSNLIICPSRTTAADTIRQLEIIYSRSGLPPKVEYMHLGGNFLEIDNQPRTQTVETFTKSQKQFFLSVGTLEPRKGYKVSLDAMEKLWAQGYDVRYVIVGKYGWSSRNLERRIASHAEYNRRLFWWENVSDADLRKLYANSRILICASVAEGFGLPIIEAGNCGLPVICSDIDVFHETTNDIATFFDVADSDMLADKLIKILNSDKVVSTPPILSWDESTKAILSFLS